MIIGESALELQSGEYILEGIRNFLFKNNFINDKWNAFNILTQNASTVGAIDLNFFNIEKENNFTFFEKLEKREFDLLYLIGSDELIFDKKNEFIIYQGSHGDRIAQIADVVLPSPAYTEQNGLFINLEGRLQKAVKATHPIGNSKEDWKIFNLLSKKAKNNELFKSYKELLENTLSKIKNNTGFDSLPIVQTKNIKFKLGKLTNEEILIRKIDYYFSNPIARASKTMSDCRLIKSKNHQSRLTG